MIKLRSAVECALSHLSLSRGRTVAPFGLHSSLPGSTIINTAEMTLFQRTPCQGYRPFDIQQRHQKHLSSRKVHCLSTSSQHCLVVSGKQSKILRHRLVAPSTKMKNASIRVALEKGKEGYSPQACGWTVQASKIGVGDFVV